MNVLFYLSAAVAVGATLLVITRRNAVHALLYMVVSMLAMALVFFSLGAPFIAALEVIIYAGAIMVLFVFAVMILSLGHQAAEQESLWLKPGVWPGPAVLSAILLAEWVYAIVRSAGPAAGGDVVEPRQVGACLFGPYLLAVELASILLLAGLVGAYHLARRRAEPPVSAPGGDS